MFYQHLFVADIDDISRFKIFQTFIHDSVLKVGGGGGIETASNITCTLATTRFFSIFFS